MATQHRKYLCQLLAIAVTLCLANGVKVGIKGKPFMDWTTARNVSFGQNTWRWVNTPARYTACSVLDDITDSYLCIPFINTNPAEEIYVNLTFKLADCMTTYDRCVHSFGLYALKTNAELPGVVSPVSHAYTFVGKYSNSTALLASPPPVYTKFNSVIRVDMSGRKGVYLSFRDKGFCGSIDGISLHYYSCPTVSGDLMEFPLKAAPNTTTAVSRIKGKCVDHSIEVTMSQNNSMECYSNGTAKFHGRCHCAKGYEKIGNECIGCKDKYFKNTVGNQACSKCGRNVKSGNAPNECTCQQEYDRPYSQGSNLAVDCERTPSEPRNLRTRNISSSWALISWEAPSRNGTGDQVKYSVEAMCESCSGPITKVLTSDLTFNLTSLKTYTVYNITVYSTNNVTKALADPGIDRFAKIRFRTLSGLPSEVRNVKMIRNDDASVTITWQEPAAKGGPDLQYRLKYGSKQSMINDTSYTIYPSHDKVEYLVSIESHTNAGYSKPVTVTVVVFGKYKAVSSGVPKKIAIGVGAGFAALLIIAIVFMVYFYRRRHPKHLQPVRLEDGKVILPNGGGMSLYVDPTTYQDLADAVRDFAKELDRQWIQLETPIGGGEFGDVYKGSINKPFEEERIVAIKTLKANANKKARDDFLSEAAYMGQFDDPNVISLEGVIVKDRPIMIITEFMSNGSLDSFLQKNDDKFTLLQLLGMGRGVASGMVYLSELSFIHRDLAARNILVNENMVCKVADFGMSRELTEEETYNTTGGKIPVRWTAPEAIQFKKFTTASDVWSYGILSWEIMSYAERPYWDWGNYEVIERLATGYRLPPPMGCPKVVHDLMLSCWHKDRVKRPKFRDVRNTIDKWIRNPELLKQEASVVTRRDECLDYASMKTLKEWLDSIKLGQYIENFTNKGLVTPRQILELTDENLRDIGIQAVGHRRKILKSIKATKGQLDNEIHRTKSMAV